MMDGRGSLRRMQRRRGAVVLAGLVLVLIALFGRVVHINLSLQKRLGGMADRQRRGHSTLPARRGMILDRNGRIVAVSRQVPDVFVDPGRVDDLAELASELGPRLSLSTEALLAKISDKPDSRYIVVARQVDAVTADAVRALHHPGVGLTEREARSYPLQTSMAHVLGFVGTDGEGLEGVEKAMDEHLRGQDGRRATVRDGRRRALYAVAAPTRPPEDGGHVVLTLDAEVQRITEEALAAGVNAYAAQSGVAVVMAPRTGEILAMACVPDFDANAAVRATGELRRNRAATDPTEPGSTFKPFIACGALDGGFITPTQTFDTGKSGTHYFGKRRVTDTSPHGVQDISGIVTHSSNIGMAMVGARMADEDLHDIMCRFGFGQPTGIEYPGECSGVVHPLDRWTSYSSQSVVMGYEVSVTPIQLAAALSAIVNDGVLLKPRLVRAVLSPSGEPVVTFQPEIVRRVVSSDVARLMAKEILPRVVKEGTGRRLKLDAYEMLGKTGTAKLPYKDRPGYEPGAYMAAFIGAAPVHDPALVAVVMIRRPDAEKGFYGGKVAGPVVVDIFAGALPYLGIAPHSTRGIVGL